VASSIETIFNTTNINTLFTTFSSEDAAITSYKEKQNLPSIAYVGTDKAFYTLLQRAAKAIADIVHYDSAKNLEGLSQKLPFLALLIDQAFMDQSLAIFNKIDSIKTPLKILIVTPSTAIKQRKQLKETYNINHIVEPPTSSEDAKILLTELIKTKEHGIATKEKSPAQQLFEDYSSGVFDKLEDLETLFDKLKNSQNEENIKNLHDAVHKISGSAGSYGYVKAGQSCKNLEVLLENRLKDKTAPSTLVSEIENSMRKINFHFNTTFYRDLNQQNLAIRPVTSQSLFVITQNEGIASFFENVAKKWNYKIAVSKDPNTASDELLQQEFKPEIIISENKFLRSAQNGIDLIKTIKSKLAAEKITFGLLVEEDSLDVSLAASSEGIDLLIKKPPSAQHIAQVFQRLTKDSKTSPPYKILVIDDDVDIGNLIVNSMQECNVEIKTLTDETKMLETLYEFAPNLLLLDIHLKKYNGWSLLKTLRSDLRYRDLKIVIITAALDKKDTHECLYDDLWLKPLTKSALQANLLQYANQHHAKSKEHIFTSFSTFQEFKKLSITLLEAAKGQAPYFFTIIAGKEFGAIKELGPGAIQDYLIASENLMSEKILGDSLRGYLGNGKFGFIFPPMEKDKLISHLEEFCTSSDYKISIPSKNGNLFVTFTAKTEGYLPAENANAFLEKSIANFI